MKEWNRIDSSFPYQGYNPFPPEAIVLVKNKYGVMAVGPSHKFWWGFEREFGEIADSVIMVARRLDKPKEKNEQYQTFTTRDAGKSRY